MKLRSLEGVLYYLGELLRAKGDSSVSVSSVIRVANGQQAKLFDVTITRLSASSRVKPKCLQGCAVYVEMAGKGFQIDAVDYTTKPDG